MPVSGIIALIVSVIMLICAFKDKKYAGFYKTINVCGRWYAFFSIYFCLTGGGSLLAIPVVLILKLCGVMPDNISGMGFGEFLLVLAITCILTLPAGLFMVSRARKKCPDMLKNKLIIDMFVIFLGTMFRASLFFLVFLWKTMWYDTEPEYYEVNGQIVHRYPGSNRVYDSNGFGYGYISDDGTKIIRG